jgi:hypothetical protein
MQPRIRRATAALVGALAVGVPVGPADATPHLGPVPARAAPGQGSGDPGTVSNPPPGPPRAKPARTVGMTRRRWTQARLRRPLLTPSAGRWP